MSEASDGLDIRAGGAIAVDTDSLRRAAARWADLAGRCAAVHTRVQTAVRLAGVAAFGCFPLFDAVTVAIRLGEQATAQTQRLRHLADLYELVELDSARDLARLRGDEETVVLLGARVAALVEGRPELAREALLLTAVWGGVRHGELERQLRAASWWTGPQGLVFAAVGARLLDTIRDLGLGTRRRPVTGPARGVALTPLARPVATAPEGFAALAARIPSGGDGRVRVERYTWADGSRAYVAYVAGTAFDRDPAREPWSLSADLEAYTGTRSVPYDATVRALELAGADRGDPVHLVGYSLGGMIAAELALDDAYDIRTAVTFGSPLEAAASAETLAVTIRHTDDPVAALAAGGFPVPVGAEGSLVVERVADPAGTPADLLLGAHDLDAYRQTAQLLDASTDPRLDAVHERFAGLRTAASVEAVVFAVEKGAAGGASGAAPRMR